MYTVYHLKELEKVGCTNNFDRRMKEQGFEPLDEYRKSVHDTIEEASLAESTLRKYYKYKEDSPMTYAQKFKVPTKAGGITKGSKENHSAGWNELSKGATKQHLMASLSQFDSITITTKGGVFEFINADYPALAKSALKSQYKDFYWTSKLLKKLKDETVIDFDAPTIHSTNGHSIPQFQLIRDWAQDKGIYDKGDSKTQTLKLMEEVGETAKAILNEDEPEIEDGLGDCLVVLINLAHLAGYTLEECLASAYGVIKKRKGKMINGTFKKEIL